MTLSHSELLELKRWNTPTIFNGWEQITQHDIAHIGINQEPCTDYMPQMGSMIGYAVTVRFQPGNPEHPKKYPQAWSDYRRYVAAQPGPKIVIVEDLDKPNCHGAFWGEVNSNIHRALDCVGTIIDGAIRDVDEMHNAGFKAIARQLCVGHGYSIPVEWNVPVQVFGQIIKPGHLIHADKHGFLAIPDEDQADLLEAARFMDSNECRTLIPAARSAVGKSIQETCDAIDAAGQVFSEAAQARFAKSEKSS